VLPCDGALEGIDMDETMRAMEQLEERFVAWARDRDDIRTALVVGSRARADHPADPWSDLDLGFTTTQPQRYLDSNDWLSEIANVWVWYPDATGVTRHVLFEGGVDAGLAPIPHSAVKLAVRFVPALRRLPLRALVPSGVRNGIERQLSEAGEYVDRGARVLLDKDGLFPRFLALLPAPERRRTQPSAAGFQELVSKFWFEAVWTAKHVRRGELWHAKCASCDGRMKELVLKMLEWHALATHGPEYDTWQDGRFLEEWGDPRAITALRDAFARYDEEDVWRALIATMDLFRWLAVETAERFGYTYPTAADANVTDWVKECMAGRRSA
jgi:aminoglycoside 6-adenylyltransferase